MSYYFKSAPLGYAADGTPLPDALKIQPLIAAFNAMGYDAMTLGNHEFNFGSEIFKAVLGDATFPILGANVTDTGEYGLADVGVEPYVEKTVGPEGIKVAILGITNHRVPNYELPSNIPGLTFSDPLVKAQELADTVGPSADAVVALTHIGFTEDPKSVEVDKNVDTNLAKTVSGVDAIVGSHSHTNPATGFGDTKYLPTVVEGPGQTPVLINQAYRYNNTLGEIFLGFRPKAGGGYELVSRAGQYLSVASGQAEDPAIKAIVDPYVAVLQDYNDKVIGETTVAIDALDAFTQETNGANLQADASVFELNKNGIYPDVHLSGAMTNRAVATSGPYPVSLKVSDMFALMPYENSLVTMKMNGPQLKAVLERAYRNYYYYKYVAGYGGYSHYTTCMIDTNSIGKITYNDRYPEAYDASKQYVMSLEIDGKAVDFADADTTYLVSTVNYLAAGSCNFNDNGVSLWPLDQIVNDTQYYVRDAVIDYITAEGTVSPAIEGRLAFVTDTTAPVITITEPMAKDYLHTASLTIDFDVTDADSGVRSVEAMLDGMAVTDGQVIDLLTLSLGSHTFTVTAVDNGWNESTKTVDFTVKATFSTLKTLVSDFYASGDISKTGTMTSLMSKLDAAQEAAKKGNDKAAASKLKAFIREVKAQTGKSITPEAAAMLIAEARYVIKHL
jgi:2',3'-cyclic-nucleotide 2'-phosphodiesterase/3'-nucleotidase/5'-nucleotidase